jgi:hypothetical protein
MAFIALDALRDGCEVYPVVDAIGGPSPGAHRAGPDRVVQAASQPASWVSAPESPGSGDASSPGRRQI